MYKVINKFKDKYTGRIYLPGDLFASDEPERLRDLLNRKLIEGTPVLDVLSNKSRKPEEKNTAKRKR